MNFRIPIAAIAIVASASAHATPSADIAAVSAHLKAVTTMTATFSQTDRAGKTLNGALTLKRPGKIRFQYEKGVPLLVVGDGSALTFIDYSVKQVQRWPIGKSPLGVLLDANKDLSRFAKIVASDDPKVVLAEARDHVIPNLASLL